MEKNEGDTGRSANAQRKKNEFLKREAYFMWYNFIRLFFKSSQGLVYLKSGRLVLCMYGHTYSKSMDQPGKVASPARGQLNRKNALSAFVPESLASRDGFGSPVPRQPSRLHTRG